MASIVIIDTENGEQQEVHVVEMPSGLTPEEIARWLDEHFPDL